MRTAIAFVVALILMSSVGIAGNWNCKVQRKLDGTCDIQCHQRDIWRVEQPRYLWRYEYPVHTVPVIRPIYTVPIYRIVVPGRQPVYYWVY